MTEFANKPAYEIARRLEVRGERNFSWFILMFPAKESDSALLSFADELKAFLGTNARLVDITGLLVDDLRSKLHNPPDDPVVLLGFDDRSPDFWSSMDVNRSGLERSGVVIFWLSAKGVSDLCIHAPNLRSFVGGSIFIVGPEAAEMTNEQRNTRLRDLAAFFGLTDDDVIRKAQAHQLPPEPEFIEWLVLLGRGDLV